MKLYEDDSGSIISTLNMTANENNYSKIFAKVPAKFKNIFLSDNYVLEASIPNFYEGKEDGLFLSKYYSEHRKNVNNAEEIKRVLETALGKSMLQIKSVLSNDFSIRKCTLKDTKQMAEVYSEVFQTYPFPINDANYIADTIKKNVNYYAVFDGKKIVSLSSFEIDDESKNSEMTDFATIPEYRGNNFSHYLLKYMENQAKNSGILVSYTIARALSYSMNITFAKSGYTYSGTLINNTNICGSLESMNVWYKPL